MKKFERGRTRADARRRAEEILAKKTRDVPREANELMKPPDERFPQEDKDDE
jgi:hypothetical protein